jgi:dihydroneopterin aldolase
MSQISTLFVRNLVFSGTHGSTGRERHESQKFRVDLKINLDVSKAAESDLLTDTCDYKYASEIARQIVEKEKHVLIEKIATRIVERICFNPKVDSAEVTISKLNVSSEFVPGITVKSIRSPQNSNLNLLNVDIPQAIDVLIKEGAVSVPIISERHRQLLVDEAETYEYHKQPEVVGPAKVREQLSSSYSLRQDGLFYMLKDDFEKLVENESKKLGEYPFSPELGFNELSLQLYEKGSIGITPHLDGFSCKNLICIFILAGTAKFALCDDREGSNPHYLDTTPGNVIIMRAPGFMGSDFRPFHFLTDVTERRTVFGLRQNVKLASE